MTHEYESAIVMKKYAHIVSNVLQGLPDVPKY